MAANKSKGLKKGTLDFLLSSSGLDKDTVNSAFTKEDIDTKVIEKNKNTEEVKYIDIFKITPGEYQPRVNFSEESLEELANSIKEQGVIQPIVVRQKDKPNEYELIAGERRWRASQLAGLNKIPAIVKKLDNKQALSIAIIENIQRENLNPLEEAKGLKRLIDEFNLTQNDAAKVIGKARASVTNLLRLLSLDKSVQYMLENDEIEMGHARAILSLPEKDQLKAAKEVYDKKLSVRQTEELIRNISNNSSNKMQNNKNKIDPNIKKLEDKLSLSLSAKVLINHKENGSGNLLIKYHNLDELDGIISKFGE